MATDFKLSAIDRSFADFICRESGNAPPVLWRLASLVSSMVANASICLDLADIGGRLIRVNGEDLAMPPLDDLREILRKTAVVGSPGDFRPLILDDGDRLYLYRYWKYERDLARVVLEKAASNCVLPDPGLLSSGFGRLFPATGEGIDWQQAAALAALRKRFCIISGGPGTGKTSTVVKILALLLEQAKGQPLRIALAAPTGKAAARLMESINRMKAGLACEESVKELIPRDVSTIHRLLGARHASVRFRYSELNPLPFDMVIVDEASMVALPLMAKLAVALKQEARLILLGDRDQLASVEAGAVLGDLCGAGRRELFSAEFRTLHAALCGANMPMEVDGETTPPLGDSLVVLKKNYRFRDESGIGALAMLINGGRGAEALALIGSSGSADLTWRAVPPADGLKKALVDIIIDGYGSFLTAGSAREALQRFDGFRVLCAMRQGPYGVSSINALVEEILASKGLIEPHKRWYRGRPVMVTANDYNLKLFNGDIGIVFPDPDADGKALVHFPTPEGDVRTVSPLRLPAHETVYAMTIHKSQGSEFERLLMLLPAHDVDVVTRELIYTGITRARSRVEIWGRDDLFVTAVARKIERKSGLSEALWPGC
ncbi:MAG: exodeoxyribonuclease V subunit alpha [Desulfuromonadales bacterium]|nr:exodeoxyribonuclease V subunit alpha [Desulfuromonadales bacterium]